MRTEYMMRLIKEIREDMEKDPHHIAAVEMCGEEVVTGKWLDIILLCDVVEEDILKEEASKPCLRDE